MTSKCLWHWNHASLSFITCASKNLPGLKNCFFTCTFLSSKIYSLNNESESFVTKCQRIYFIISAPGSFIRCHKFCFKRNSLNSFALTNNCGKFSVFLIFLIANNWKEKQGWLPVKKYYKFDLICSEIYFCQLSHHDRISGRVWAVLNFREKFIQNFHKTWTRVKKKSLSQKEKCYNRKRMCGMLFVLIWLSINSFNFLSRDH